MEQQITDSAKEGYALLFDAGKTATKIQFNEATIAFDEALDSFVGAEKEIGFISSAATFYSRDTEVSVAADALLGGGKDFALAGSYFIEALEQFNKIPVYFFANNSKEKKTDLASLSDTLKLGLEKIDANILSSRKFNISKAVRDAITKNPITRCGKALLTE